MGRRREKGYSNRFQYPSLTSNPRALRAFRSLSLSSRSSNGYPSLSKPVLMRSSASAFEMGVGKSDIISLMTATFDGDGGVK